MANDKNFKVKNGLQAGRYLHKTAGLSDPYDGVTIRPVFHYDMIADVFTADLQLDEIYFAGTSFESNTNEGFETTRVDTSISNYSSATWSSVTTGSTAGRVNIDSGGTPSTGTGRTDAAGGIYYLYFESTSPANSANYDFLLRGAAQELSATPTFSFYEARNGTSSGNLNVYVDVVESPWASIPVGLSSLLLQTTGDLDAWVQKAVPMDMFLPGAKIADLSRATYFTHTLTGNTTLLFENPPPSGTAGSFALEVTGADVTVGYDLANAAYDSVELSVSGQTTGPHGIKINNDGTKLYLINSTGDAVLQYSMTTANDLSTASYDSVSFSVSSQAGLPRGLAFNGDGTKMYVVGSSSDSIFQYSLSTAFDVSTASYDSVTLSLSSQDNNPMDVVFNNDGTKMFIVGLGGDNVYQYSFTTAYDLSTASYDSVALNLSLEETNPRALAFNADGTKLFIAGNIGNDISQYSLSTAFDLSTASYDSVTFSVASQDGQPYGIAFSSDGAKMFISGDANDKIFQYSTASSTPATITYPSSVKWSGATTPDAPAAGEKDVYTFVTTDGGTTYYGKQAGDAVA